MPTKPILPTAPSLDRMREALVAIAHMRCDGDSWFLTKAQEEAGHDGADISNDLTHDQLVEALLLAREALGIQQSGPICKPTKVHQSA